MLIAPHLTINSFSVNWGNLEVFFMLENFMGTLSAMTRVYVSPQPPYVVKMVPKDISLPPIN